MSAALIACDGSAASLPEAWRSRAADLRRWGAPEEIARAYECAANELEEAERAEDDRLVPVSQAAELAGRHRDTIGAALRDGRLTNQGVKHRPLVRVGDLRRTFPRPSVASSSKHAYDADADARVILGTRRGGT